MFYVDTSQFSNRREAVLLRILPTVVVFVALVAITGFSWTASKVTIRQEQTQLLQRKNAETSALISQHFDTYEDILRGAAGLFNASQYVTRDEWHTYLSTYNIAARYPGVQGIGYASVVQPANLAAHTAEMRASGVNDFTLYPPGDRAVYTTIDYIEPQGGRNDRALGYDMYGEPTRRAAMDAARDSGQITTSGIVTLVQDARESNGQPGFLIYLPIYTTATVPDTVEARRQSLRGFVYAPFRTYDLVSKTVQDNDDFYGFKLYAINSEGRPQVYESNHFKQITGTPNTKVATATVALAGSAWELQGVASSQIVNGSVRSRPAGIFWGGLAFSTLTAGLLYIVLGNRARALAMREERGIQRAKDELLALASHQLRTPATGVKQYIGLLKEGFAGELSGIQQELVDKAYASNERQLVTINEMLFVARSDAGRWRIEKELVDVSEMMHDIIDEQRDIIAGRQQRLYVKIPTKAAYIQGDKRYLRMALENVLSNATKYTKAKGSIRVDVTARRATIRIIVRDNGVGVALEHQRLLFQKFSRIPNELTNKVVGSGIGLYLANRVVSAHKGNITFESRPDVGTTVTITLPRASVARPSEKRSSPLRRNR